MFALNAQTHTHTNTHVTKRGVTHTHTHTGCHLIDGCAESRSQCEHVAGHARQHRDDTHTLVKDYTKGSKRVVAPKLTERPFGPK